MKIGILFNFQHESLRIALGALLPGTDFVSLDLAQAFGNETLRTQFAAILRTCDHVVAQAAPPSYGPLATSALRAVVPRLHVLPAFRFAGFHPDTVRINLDGVDLAGPTGAQHSRIAIAGFLAGLSVRETADLYNRLVFARLGYCNRFDSERADLIARYAVYGIDLHDQFPTWLAPGCFMHGVAQPRMRVMLDLARAVCALADLPPAASVSEADLPDPLALLPMHPVFPDIAAAAGVAPSGAFRGATQEGHRARVMGAEAFVQACQELFRRTPVATLRAVDGVTDAMAALALAEPAPPRLAPRATGPQTTVFLTWFGDVLGIDIASGMLINRAFMPEDANSIDLLADLRDRAVTEPIQSAMMGGVTIAPAGTGAVSFARAGLYLCAAPATLGVRFNRQEASFWESFLPVALSDLENLRILAASSWMVQGTGQILPGSLMRPLQDFRFAVGDLVLDLRHEMPVPVECDGAALAFRIGVGPHSLILEQDLSPPADDEILLLARPETDPLVELATREEFRMARQGRLRIASPPELLHPPLTACDADRDWMHARYFDQSAGPGQRESIHRPRIGRHACDVVIRRASDALLMLGRGVEGVLIEGAYVVKDGGFLAAPRQVPPHLRGIGHARLLNRAAASAAPAIDGPVCVFYNPNLQNYYHWLTEALLSLHVLAPHLPPATRLVLPGTLAQFRRSGETCFDHTRYLPALGFGQYPTIELHAPFARLADAIWLETDAIHAMPAAALQSFRARAMAVRQPGNAPRRRLYIKRTGKRGAANSDAVERYLAPRGFETVQLESVPAAAQIDLFAKAEFVIAAHGAALANLLFCQAGTRVLELSPDCEFRGNFWLCAEKLGLAYGVLPCRTSDGGFDGDLTVDETRFSALVDMLEELAP